MQTKRANLTFGIFIGLSLGVLGLFFIYSTQFLPQQKAARQALETERQKVQRLEESVQKLENDQYFLVSGGAHPQGESITQPFTFSTFGINSPHFKDKNVTVTNFQYQLSTFTRKHLELEGKDDDLFNYTVSVWTFPDTFADRVMYFDCFYECHGGWSATDFEEIKQTLGRPQPTRQGLAAYYQAQTPSTYSLTVGKYFIEVPFTPPTGEKALVEVRAHLKPEVYQAYSGSNKEDLTNWFTKSGHAQRARQRLQELVDSISIK